jgi:acyl-CoA thioester hydrolase
MSFIAETIFHVRYVETDAQGVVNHAHYVSYLEEGRSDYLRQRGSSYADFERDGYFLAVTDLNVRYLKAIHYDNKISIHTWLTEARSRTLTFQYEIRHTATGEIHATATTKHICLNRAGAVTRIPASWAQWMD